MADPSVTYLAFDIESVADGDLVSRIRYPGEKPGPDEAVARYRAELMEKYESDFTPYTFHLPISVITENFWRGWEKYRRPTLVSFNGRTFDIPLLELCAFRFGVSVPAWFNVTAKSFEQYRNRYNMDAHIDLQEVLTNFGSTRFTGGLNLAANLLGKPGKMDVQGFMVQDLYDEGKLQEINDYCRCDVLDTYFVFLRTRVLFGLISLDEEQGLIAQTKTWLIKKSSESAAYRIYLERWGDWENPWAN
jgi:predicted PolB exonuclease-like 3'-5' exonuclease